MLRRIRHFLINFWPERLGPTDRCQTTEDELHECRVEIMNLRAKVDAPAIHGLVEQCHIRHSTPVPYPSCSISIRLFLSRPGTSPSVSKRQFDAFVVALAHNPGGWVRIAIESPEPEQVGCQRCGKPLAYPGAEYCGAACSAQRRDGKTPADF